MTPTPQPAQGELPDETDNTPLSQAMKRVRFLESENAQLSGELRRFYGPAGLKRVSEIMDERDRYRGALEFYARRETWADYGTIALEDSGEVAGQALSAQGAGGK